MYVFLSVCRCVDYIEVNTGRCLRTCPTAYHLFVEGDQLGKVCPGMCCRRWQFLVLDLVISSTRQGCITINWLITYLSWLQCYDLMRSYWNSQSFSEHVHLADLSMLALRVVAARVLVILHGSLTSQIEIGPTLMWFRFTRNTQSPTLRARFSWQIYHACYDLVLNPGQQRAWQMW